MKTERIYTELNRFIENLEDEKKNEMKTYIKSGSFPKWLTGAENENLRIVFDLLIEAKNELENQKAKSNGTTGMKKTAEKIIKHAVENGRGYWARAFRTDEGKYLFCDGYRLIESPDNFGFEIADDENHKFAGFFKLAEESNQDETRELPTVAYLTEYIRSEKKQIGKYDKVTYGLGDGLPAFNAEYLKIILQAVGDNAVMKYQHGHECAMTIFHGDNGRAILMPVKKLVKTGVSA